MQLAVVVTAFRNIAPLNLAEKWDNVGLLTSPTVEQPVTTIFLTNDLTEDVINEAIEQRAQFIFAYHPPIFEAWKQLSPKNTKQRIILKAIEHRISVYSPHSALDAAAGGLNDWLAEGLGDLDTVVPLKLLEPSADSFKVVMRMPSASTENTFIAAMPELRWEPSSASTVPPPVGSVEFIVPKNRLGEFSSSASKACNYLSMDIAEVVRPPASNVGIGRLATLKKAEPLSAIIERVKKHLGLRFVRVASAQQQRGIRTVAICAGSGASVLKGVKADLYLTGELGYHDILAALADGASVLLTEHSGCERPYLVHLRSKLMQALSTANVVISQRDTEPLQVL